MGESEQKSGRVYWFFEKAVLICLIGFFIWVAMPNLVSNGRHQPSFVCINNLLQLDGAKNVLIYEHYLTNGEIVTMNQLTNYLRPPVIRKCPSGGIYTIGKVGEPVTCSLGTTVTPAHVLR